MWYETINPRGSVRGKDQRENREMADTELDVEAIAALRKKRQFKKFTFRGVELDKLLDLSHEELLNYVHSRARRRMQRGMKRKPLALVKKLRKAKAGM